MMKLRRILLTLMIFVLILPAAFANGGQDSGATRDAPQLDGARLMTTDDTSGYKVRISAWWNGPDNYTMVGRETGKLWAAAEEKYDIELEWIQMPNPNALVEKLTASVLAGDPFADIIHVNASDVIPALAGANLVLPLDDYFDFSDPKWPESIAKTARFNGKTYGVNTMLLGGGAGIWYNRSLFQREGLPDLHELQDSGRWTWEKYFEIAQRATRDTDGDGQVDQFGLAVGYEIEYPLIWSNGGRIVREGADGFRFAMDDPAAIEALEFISRIYDAQVTTYGEDKFIAGKAAMYGGELFQGRNMMENMEDDYGFVFYPRGPKMDHHASVASTPILQVFPANLHYPPEILANILEDTFPFHLIPAIQQEFFEGQLAHQEDIDTVYGMMDVLEYSRRDSFPGLLNATGSILRDIRRGSSASTAVEQYAQLAQTAIDAMVDR